MLGLPMLPKNSACLLLLLLVFALAGCGGSKQAVSAKSEPQSLRQFLDMYEKTFNPSEYDLPVDSIKRQEEQQHQIVGRAALVTEAVPETIPGFRIQILFTQEIDEAATARETLNDKLPDEWSYVVYEPPYYKVRVGNFMERSDANPVLKAIVSMGYKDAWIVPDRVIKNPPPKLPDTDIEPARPDSGR
jgi:hypothetical protein